jgi:hypothetical protein
MGERRYSPTILDFGTRRRCDQHHVQATQSWDRALVTQGFGGGGGGPHSRSGLCGEKSLAPAKNRTPAVQPAARRYTNWAVLSPSNNDTCRNKLLSIYCNDYLEICVGYSHGLLCWSGSSFTPLKMAVRLDTPSMLVAFRYEQKSSWWLLNSGIYGRSASKTFEDVMEVHVTSIWNAKKRPYSTLRQPDPLKRW